MLRYLCEHLNPPLRARDSRSKCAPLSFSKSRKNRWRVETDGATEIRFAYRVYCREMSVRTNWVEDSFALLNGAPTFVTVAGCLERPHEVLKAQEGAPRPVAKAAVRIRLVLRVKELRPRGDGAGSRCRG